MTLFSRRGHVLNSQYPEIAKAFEFLPDSTIVDGEVVAVDEKGRPSFAALQRFRSRPHRDISTLSIYWRWMEKMFGT